MDLAVLMPLADGNGRYYLAKGLGERGLDEEVARQWDLIVRTGESNSSLISNSDRPRK